MVFNKCDTFVYFLDGYQTYNVTKNNLDNQDQKISKLKNLSE